MRVWAFLGRRPSTAKELPVPAAALVNPGSYPVASRIGYQSNDDREEQKRLP